MNLTNILIYIIGETYGVLGILYSYAKLNFTEFKVSNYKESLIIIIGTILLLINNLFIPAEYRLLLSFFIVFLINSTYYLDNIKNVIINNLFIIIITTILELLFSAILLNGFYNIEHFNQNVFAKTIFTMFIFTMVCLILKNNKISSKIKIIKEFLSRIISVELLVVLLLIIINIFMYTYGTNMQNNIYILSILISVVYITFTIIDILKKQIIIESLKAKNKVITNSYKANSESLNEFRILKHNLKNDLYSIKVLMPTEKQYIINDLLKKYNSKYEWLNNLENIPDGLEGIIYLKSKEAKKQKVKIIINYDTKSKIKEKDFLDLCDLLGILLDNAIEASSNSKNKIVILDVYENKKFIIFKIKNNFKNRININKIGKKNYSTKTKKSGIGLYYINNLKNKTLKIKLSIINNGFISTIYYKK